MPIGMAEQPRRRAGFPALHQQGRLKNPKVKQETEESLREAAERMGSGEFSIHELAANAGTSEETARRFAEKAGFRPGSERGLFRQETGPQDQPATRNEKPLPGQETADEKEVRAELFVAAYMRGFDAGFQRGFDIGVKTVN